MLSEEIRRKYLDFFADKNHCIIPSASLIPENDPTTLFTGSGMQPLVPYLLGERHPLGRRLADSQKCFRSKDIDDVGDNRHTTFFEMLGNWSLGDYFKKEQINWVFEFLTKELKLNPEKIFVTVFSGNEHLNIPKDNVSVKLWKENFKKLGIDAKVVDSAEEKGLQNGKIFYYNEEKNWWSRSGMPDNMPINEPGGPDSEIFWDFRENLRLHENSPWKNKPCHVNCDCGRFLEIGNSVFMEYKKAENGFIRLSQQNVDFGGGLERLTAASNDDFDIFNCDFFAPLKEVIENISNKKYGTSQKETKSFRIILDHLRAATFLVADGAFPSNKGQGYFARRLIRRAIRFAYKLGIDKDFTDIAITAVINKYNNYYPYLDKNKENIINNISEEERKFRKTLENGLKIFEKLSHDNITGKDAFDLYQSYGFPAEMIIELAREKNINVDVKDFEKLLYEHRNLSRTSSAGMFKGGLADTSEQTIELHTAAHLFLAALKKILNNEVNQKGSNITAERLRFDFSYDKKLTEKQISDIEHMVNQIIKEGYKVRFEEMDLADAKKIGATGVFDSKYGEKVKVYTISNGKNIFSKEICGGPHVDKTSVLGTFKIIKEESVSSGVRRIKAVLK